MRCQPAVGVAARVKIGGHEGCCVASRGKCDVGRVGEGEDSMCVCVKEGGGTVLSVKSVEILSWTSNCYSPDCGFWPSFKFHAWISANSAWVRYPLSSTQGLIAGLRLMCLMVYLGRRVLAALAELGGHCNDDAVLSICGFEGGRRWRCSQWPQWSRCVEA